MEPTPDVITDVKLDLKLSHRGKVRDTFHIIDRLLMVSSDRLSAFDVVFKEGIPQKGEVLNSLSLFWFKQTRDIIRNHFITNAIPAYLPKYLEKRSMIIVPANPVKLECVVRGYITGSALKEYEKTGKVCGMELPPGLKNGSELPQPIFTPSSKAEHGHDVNLTWEQASQVVGEDMLKNLKQKSLELYSFGRAHAKRCGLVLADTKFEFGTVEDNCGHKGTILIDELLTPDSSRYWLKEEYEKGKLVSLDKQFVRDYLEKTGWNKEPPPPALPKDVIDNTSKRYLQAYKMLTGKELSDNGDSTSLQTYPVQGSF